MEKRKQAAVSLKRKVEIIDEAEKHPHKKLRELADQYKIGLTTVRDALKNKLYVGLLHNVHTQFRNVEN